MNPVLRLIYTGIITVPKGTCGIWEKSQRNLHVTVEGQKLDSEGRYYLAEGIYKFCLKSINHKEG